MTYSWQPVTTRAEFDAWFSVTKHIYGAQPTHFVPPLKDQVLKWWQHPEQVGQIQDLQFWMVSDPTGQVVARTTTHRHAAFSQKLGYQAQLFGFTEWLDQPGLGDFLFGQLRQIATQAKAEGLFGPVNLLPNQAGGVVTAGFDQPAFVDGAYSPPYYAQAYQQAGFVSRFEAQTWQTKRGDWVAKDLNQVFESAGDKLPAGVTVRQINGLAWGKLIPAFAYVLNASFAQLGYYTFIPEVELRRQVQDLALLLDPQIALYLERDGQPIAFCLCIPNISSALQATHGEMKVWDWIKLLWRRRSYQQAVLIVQGTLPEYQGQGLSKALTHHLVKNLVAGGYTQLSTTWIEPSNPASSAQLKKVGACPLHQVTFFETRLARA